MRFPFSVTSWGRTAQRNARPEIAGKPNSRHLLWLAVDVVLDDPAKEADFMTEARRLGLGCLNERDHIHVQVP
jgi:hypothetical protein